MDRSFLDKHYEKITEDNRDRILAGGTGDGLLWNAPNDSRMALVVLIRISPAITRKINDRIRELREIEPDMYYYPDADLHITVMDILRGQEGRRIPDELDQYIHCIKECSREIRPFEITFDGLAASDNAVMVRGYYEEELLKFREALRTSLAQHGLPLEERYRTISSHITIARLYERFQNADKLLEYVEKSHKFGTMTVDSMEISFHNWYDTKKQVLSVAGL